MERINIAELLKDCPKGMELDCAIYENVTLVEVKEGYDYPIVIETPNGQMLFSKYGCFSKNELAKCVIFPKGKTTWEGFAPPGKFKDGDVCYIKTKKFEHIFIFKINENYNLIQEHAGLCEDHFYTENPVCTIDDVKEHRLATEEEKQKLFCAIKDNGYKWNTNTKTLEKLIKPKFKVGDIIQDIIGICKVKITEVNIEDEYYLYKSLNINGIGGISFNRQDDWELVPDKFDINNLKPFKSEVLVRDSAGSIWRPAIFGCIDKSDCVLGCYYVLGGICWRYCIPCEGNEHLLGKTDDCEEYYKIWE